MVIFWMAFQAFKPSVRSDFVSEGRPVLFAENISISHAPINDGHFVSTLMSFGNRHPRNFLRVGDRTSLCHSKRNCRTLNVFGGFEIGLVGQTLYHLKLSNRFFDPCGRLTCICANEHSVNGRTLAFRSAAFENMRFSVRPLIRIVSYLGHDPCPFNAFTSTSLSNDTDE